MLEKQLMLMKIELIKHVKHWVAVWFAVSAWPTSVAGNRPKCGSLVCPSPHDCLQYQCHSHSYQRRCQLWCVRLELHFGWWKDRKGSLFRESCILHWGIYVPCSVRLMVVLLWYDFSTELPPAASACSDCRSEVWSSAVVTRKLPGFLLCRRLGRACWCKCQSRVECIIAFLPAAGLTIHSWHFKAYAVAAFLLLWLCRLHIA